MTVLQTERLELRRFTVDDADLLLELDGDPAVTRFINGGQPTPRAVVEDELLPRIIADYDRAPGFGRWAAFERATGAFLGWISLRRDDPASDEAELGYRLRQDAWGKGYATEGARALVARAFDQLGVGRVWATTMTVNQGSRRVMEKAGLRFERTFFEEWPDVIEGGEQGDVEYALTADEWRARRMGDSKTAISGQKKAGS